VNQSEQPSYGIECVNPWAPCLYPPTSERGTTFCKPSMPEWHPSCRVQRSCRRDAGCCQCGITSGDTSGSSAPDVVCIRNPKQHINLGV